MSGFGVYLLSALSGYFALSQEILWVRAIAYATEDRPRVFGHVLGAYLLGIALGSLLVERRTARRGTDPAGLLPGAFLVSGVIAYAALPLLARLYVASASPLVQVAPYAAVLLLGLCGGVIFPAVSHLATRDEAGAGRAVSLVYFANIVGSVFGPLFTTFYLMDRLPFDGILRLMALGSALTALLALALIGRRAGRALPVVAGVVAFLAVAATVHGALYDRLHEKLQFKTLLGGERTYRWFVETRTGTAAAGPEPQNTIWGAGVYDGRFNIDPYRDTNHIRRAYFIPTLHRRPAKMLDIGLSGGSWARVVTMHPSLESMDVVEISTAYLDLMKHYPEQEKVLHDPRVTLYIDDGRRFLNQHPERKYDFILMNAMLHWRNQSTALLSRDFLVLAKRHLLPGGVVYYNATESSNVLRTAAEVFRHVVLVGTFVAASDAPFDMTVAERREALRAFQLNGQPVFDESRKRGRVALGEMAAAEREDLGPGLRARDDLWVISDDNMVPEFKETLPVFGPSRSSPGWGPVLRKIAGLEAPAR